MRALRFHGARDLRIDDVPPPGAPGAGEVLVAPVVCGICGTDVHEYEDGPRRTWPNPEPHPLTGALLPQILGHEFSAEVVAVGPGVATVAPGDRVSVMPLVSCGRCRVCLAGNFHHCELRAAIGLRHPWGGLAELALVGERQVARLPDNVSWEQGALVEPASVSAAAVRAGGVQPGHHVLVTGAGPIGALAALAAKAAGAADVVVSEPNERRAARVRALGFEVIDPSTTSVVEACRERTDGVGMDVAIECAGSPPAIRDALAAIRRGGTVAVAALHVRPPEVDLGDLVLSGKSLIGSVAYPFDSWPALLERVASGEFPVERVVSRRIGLDSAIRNGFEHLLDPAADEAKVLINLR